MCKKNFDLRRFKCVFCLFCCWCDSNESFGSIEWCVLWMYACWRLGFCRTPNVCGIGSRWALCNFFAHLCGIKWINWNYTFMRRIDDTSDDKQAATTTISTFLAASVECEDDDDDAWWKDLVTCQCDCIDWTLKRNYGYWAEWKNNLKTSLSYFPYRFFSMRLWTSLFSLFA